MKGLLDDTETLDRRLLQAIELGYGVEEVLVANHTARGGRVAERALVPRVVLQLRPTGQVLDFGAGPNILHTTRLREAGLDVVAWDFGLNFHPDRHDKGALEREYCCVYASNVLNVQATKHAFHLTFGMLLDAVCVGGVCVFNFPKEPRKCTEVDLAVVQRAVEGANGFSEYERHGTKHAPVYVLRRNRR